MAPFTPFLAEEIFQKVCNPELVEGSPGSVAIRVLPVSQEILRFAQDNQFGSSVHLASWPKADKKLIDEKLPLVREISKDFAGIDPVHEPIPVMPVAHYFMGGVHTNIKTEVCLQGQNPLPGLFAAGETACVTINGANRLGSNSLAECLVFGKVAGETAAEYAATSHITLSLSKGDMRDEENRLHLILQNEGMERVAPIREELQKTMQKHAGIERDGAALQAGLFKILELRERSKKISLFDHSELFNTEFTALLELENMFDVAEAVSRSAIARKESRGSHFRTDFPARNDERFLKHLLVKKTEQGMLIEEMPVTITQWQPQKRRY